MAEHDTIIIGGGHNGLVTAAYLARAGRRPLVLEARAEVGGRSVTGEIKAGFRCSTLLHAAGPLLPRIARELELARHGLQWLAPGVRLLAPSPDGRALALFDDPARTASGLTGHDADTYPEFAATMARIGRALAPLLAEIPPAALAPSAGDLFGLARLGRRLRRLGKRDLYRVLRWGPMAVADLVGEWFRGDLLRAALAARGLHAAFAGPRSGGTGVGLLLQAAHDGHATAPAAFPRGGMGALSAALAGAATAAGAQIRTGARVQRILVDGGAAVGVALAGGEELRAQAVVSGLDPRRTFLELVDPGVLGPDFTGKIRHYRSVGTAAKVNLALGRLPRLPFHAGQDPALLTGRIHVGPTLDDLERAFDAVKYGQLAPRLMLDVVIPTLLEPALAPPGAHVMSIWAQFVPHAVDRHELVKAVVQTLAPYAPDLADTIVGHQVLTPADLEAEYGLSGGHLLHGEASLDQLFAFRPLIGWAQHRTPLERLYLCGSGTHPGGGITGGSGANASRVVLRGLRG
jgi:phytoene dehydrogenase-like protein